MCLYCHNELESKEPYEVKFSGGKIHGQFKGLKANIEFDKTHPEASRISASIDINTIATGFFLKNSHAKDALDADKYPVIRFRSNSVTKNGNGYKTDGNLTLKGVTKPVTIYFTFEDHDRGGTFRGSFKFAPISFGKMAITPYCFIRRLLSNKRLITYMKIR